MDVSEAEMEPQISQMDADFRFPIRVDPRNLRFFSDLLARRTGWARYFPESR